MPLQPGATLQNRYVIDHVLGHGGMGTVYLALHGALGNKPVAVKELNLPGRGSEEYARAVKQFNREAELLAHLEHPCLVGVSDFFEEGEHHYLVMNYVDGQTLEDVLADSPSGLDVNRVLDWMDPVCAVLGYLHGHAPPIIYRDLKPSNIMVDKHDRIRLLDFGIARVIEAEKTTSTVIKGMGSIGFSPPEQFSSAHTDARSDIFALGATMYNLLTGTVMPFSIDLMLGVTTLVSPRDLNRDIPLSLEALMLRLLAMLPEKRPASIAEVREALAGMRQDVAPASGGRASLPRPPAAEVNTDTVRPSVVSTGAEQKPMAAPWVAASAPHAATPPIEASQLKLRPSVPTPPPPRTGIPPAAPPPPRSGATVLPGLHLDAGERPVPGSGPTAPIAPSHVIAAPVPAWVGSTQTTSSEDVVVYGSRRKFSLRHWYERHSWLMALLFTVLAVGAALPYCLAANTLGPLAFPHVLLYRLGTAFFMSSRDPNALGAGGIAFMLGVPAVLAAALLLLQRWVGCAFALFWLSQMLLEGWVYLASRHAVANAAVMRIGWEALARQQGYDIDAATSWLHHVGFSVMCGSLLALAGLLTLGAPARHHENVQVQI